MRATAAALAAALTAIVALGATSAGAQQEGSPQAPAGDQGPPACSVVAERPWRGNRPPRPLPRAVHAWVQCNFRVTRLTLRTNAPLARVQARPRLYGADSGDSLTCRRSARRRATCTGSIGAFVRARVKLRLRRPTCDAPRFRTLATATGGIDCDPGAACPGIALGASAGSGRALGC